MALRAFNASVFRQMLAQLPRNSITPMASSLAGTHTLARIGKREIVGYGWNGENVYFDRFDYPMPGIRFREPTNEINVLREKEKGDWKKLTIDEKKALYRASFCQTFAEMDAPTGEWKSCVGISLIFVAMAIWVSVLLNLFVYEKMPKTFSEERKKAQLKRMIDLEINPVTGIASQWDYQNNRWKN